MTSFDAFAAEYEAGRPDYPEAVYDVLEPLRDALILEGGAGTGVATRSLRRRGARVVPFDVGHAVLLRAVARSPRLPAVVADGAAMPFRDGCADLLCFAQSWHWVDPDRRCGEAARVLRPGARWAAWWSHARADGEEWFDGYWDAVEASTAARREQRDANWGEELRSTGLFEVADLEAIPWIRRITVEEWLMDERSKSYVANLPVSDRTSLLDAIERLCRDRFPDGDMSIPYETWLWIASKI